MMKRMMVIGLLGGVSILLGSCATMSEQQCLVGDWGSKGYQDGLSGYQTSRLDDHAKACAKHGVATNPNAYFSAREEGLRTYCQWDNGFRVGRNGSSYGGVCSPEEERDFLPAYQDGRTIHAAESALSEAESRVSSAVSRIRNREDKLEAKERELRQEGLSREERARIRDRIREVRGELRTAHNELRQAEVDLRYIEIEARAVIRSVGSRYGIW